MTTALRITFVSILAFTCSNGWADGPAEEELVSAEAAATPEAVALLSYIRIPSEKLPDNVQLIENLRPDPFLPIKSNPSIIDHPVAIEFMAVHFGLFEPADLAAIRYGVVAFYQEKTDASKIGVYGLIFADDESAKVLFKKLRAQPEAPPVIRKGNLLLYVWKGNGVSDAAFSAIRDYFTDADTRRRQVLIGIVVAIVATACAMVAVRRRGIRNSGK